MSRRARGMLTKKDVEFLKSDNYYEGENARQMRYQRRADIRSRIVSSILDFDIVRRYLSKEEREKIFRDPDKNGAHNKAELEASVYALLEWVYLGCRKDDNFLDFEKLLRSAVENAEEKYHLENTGTPVNAAVEFEVNVQSEYAGVQEFARLLEEGEPVNIRDMFHLPMVDKIPINPDKVDRVIVNSPHHPSRFESQRQMIETILIEHLGIEAEVEIQPVVGPEGEEDANEDTEVVVPPEEFEGTQ